MVGIGQEIMDTFKRSISKFTVSGQEITDTFIRLASKITGTDQEVTGTFIWSSSKFTVSGQEITATFIKLQSECCTGKMYFNGQWTDPMLPVTARNFAKKFFTVCSMRIHSGNPESFPSHLHFECLEEAGKHFRVSFSVLRG
ncbi:hypothetical protein AVEN_14930-1 [Araneus ventricosus]|uniref:Uncharacterized protein n=1 Tax=Araneus ventricosus TaxID=182803 RepID=A0A4Y2WH74_ARAVE|nr:hypothetical protein AVEN_14930-1 [Araneus ventricosus]